ncbi:MAG: hypothetical protein REI78_04535 [Pedobacter sp.]|nr:hypothetical protein [Pedobacter sp.]MDQ8052267.1 hypothetical protein [Pedobacter sp.]
MKSSLARAVAISISSILFSYLLFAPKICFSQTLSPAQLKELLIDDGVYQTEKFSKACLDLLSNFDPGRYQLQIAILQANRRNRENKRLQIRMFLYERMAYLRFSKPDPKGSAGHYFNMIKMAGLLGDEQLLSDLYIKYAQVCIPSKKLYYLLKCIEIRKNIGLQYFTDLAAAYYHASELLYQLTDYKSSAKYASRCVSLYRAKEKHDFLFQYILAIDIAASSYLRIQQPIAAIKYYQLIGQLIDDKTRHPDLYQSPMTPDMLEIWRGVVHGGIGKAYVLQKKYDEGYALLLKNLKSSTTFHQFEDVAEVLNVLAKIDEQRSNYSLALSRYLKAYSYAQKSSNLMPLINSSAGISLNYAKLGQYAQAYSFYQQQIKWRDQLEQQINQNKLENIKAQVDYEKMQKAYQQTKNNLLSQKRVRNSIVIGIIFLAVITILMFNRKRLQLKLQQEKLENEKQRSKAQIDAAQQQIDFITQNVAEKNALIQQLQSQLKLTDHPEIGSMLSHFTILTDEDWKKFKMSFETINPNYLYRLKQKLPQLTQGEQRIILLAKLGFNNKEMANASGVSAETIRSVISRLRKKFNLNIDIRSIANSI